MGETDTMRKKFFWCMVLVFVIFAIAFFSNKDGKKNVEMYIRKNRADLHAYAEKISENTINTTEHYDGWEVTYWSNTGIVEFRLKDTFGLGSSYTGFYYSSEDVPLGFQGNDLEFVEKTPGWIWYENYDNSDNWEYTEKIMDHWYWFKVHF